MCKCNKNKCCCCEHIPKPIPPSIPDLKTVALLELTNSGVSDFDNTLKTTFEYYFKNSEEFKPFPIIDTEGELEKTIYYLDLYYSVGYRIFIGFNRSSILQKIKLWFDEHPDAVGISPVSTGTSLDIPKNIYRILPSNTKIAENVTFSPYLLTRRKIFYVYSKGEPSAELILGLLLSPISPIKNKLVPIGILPNSSNINDVQTIYLASKYNALTDATIEFLYVKSQRQNFINLFTPQFLPIPTFDISGNSIPLLNDSAKIVWNNFYYSYQNVNVSTSPLWRKGYEDLGYYVYNQQAINTLQLNNFLKKKIDVNDLSNYGYVQEFDENNDAKYFSFSGLKFVYDNITKKEEWKPDSVFIKDPIFGTFYKSLLAP